MKRPPHFTLELLRGGPPHNQLVSPITEYLALCGDAAPFNLRLPFEHRDLINCLRMLRYGVNIAGDTDRFRQLELERLARQLGNLLGSIPAFGAEMSSIDPPGNGDVVHLRLVLAGNELSLVPWEIAQVPDGLPGAGLSLLLQPRVPISMTREVRGASRRQFQWNRIPQVLFASASAGDFPPNTLEAHLLSLRRALEIWTYQNWWQNGWQRNDYPIDIIEFASVSDIRKKCLEKDYTHVHILAHGKRMGSSDESRYGLYLHKSGEPNTREVVSGEQLAHALLPSRSNRGASDPMMVTLATCDSANQVETVNPGGSVAHILHQMGVPWVIASQFPLTVTGSVILAEELYTEIFQGTDPRMAIHRVRQHLTTRFGDRHDWATVVAYASFPYDFDTQISQFRKRAVIEKHNRIFALVDGAVLDHIQQNKNPDKPTLSLAELHEALTELIKLSESEEAANASLNRENDRLVRADFWAKRAATRKRLAEIQYLISLRDGSHQDLWVKILGEVFQDYKTGLEQGIQVDHWILVQYFVLRLVSGPGLKPFSERENILFSQAYQSISMDLLSNLSETRIWAWSSYVDLLMVALADPANIESSEYIELNDIKPKEIEFVLQNMVSESDNERACPAIWPTFRQFWRWHMWWNIPKLEEASEKGFYFLKKFIDEKLNPSENPVSSLAVASKRTTVEDEIKVFHEGLPYAIKTKTIKLKKPSAKKQQKPPEGR